MSIWESLKIYPVLQISWGGSMATCGAICSALADWDLVRAKFQIIRLLCKNLRKSAGLSCAEEKNAYGTLFFVSFPLVFAHNFTIRGIQAIKICNDVFYFLPQKLSRLNNFSYFIS